MRWPIARAYSEQPEWGLRWLGEDRFVYRV
jgi:hypothetical protein